jgi:hypothetical protein
MQHAMHFKGTGESDSTDIETTEWFDLTVQVTHKWRLYRANNAPQ